MAFSMAHLLPKVLINTQEALALSDMTEKLLTGTLNLNTNKRIKLDYFSID